MFLWNVGIYQRTHNFINTHKNIIIFEVVAPALKEKIKELATDIIVKTEINGINITFLHHCTPPPSLHMV
jgi:hypothetical protein